MTTVIDASVACKWFFNEPLAEEARTIAASDATFVAPDMILVECANAAWRRVRSGTITPAHARALLGSLPLWFDSLTARGRVAGASVRDGARARPPGLRLPVPCAGRKGTIGRRHRRPRLRGSGRRIAMEQQDRELALQHVIV